MFGRLGSSLLRLVLVEGRAFVAVPLLVGALGLACSTADLKTPIPSSPAADGADPGDDDGSEPETTDSSSSDGGGDAAPEGLQLKASSGVTIQVQPSDAGKAILAAINGAKKSVHMTMYLLTDDAIINALGALKKAGKDVKVILNKTFPPDGGDNQPAFSALTSKGVSVTWAPAGYSFTHAKTVVIDSSQALIMTMNLTASSAKTNREYIATDTDPDDVAVLEELFEADRTNMAIHVKSKLVISPTDANTNSPREMIKALIDSAKSSVDFEVQSLSDGVVVDALIHAHEANLDVRVVTDGDQLNTPAQQAAVAKLKEHGVPLRSMKSPDVHAKAIVIDESRTWVGSQNMTPTALDNNREVGVLTDAKSEATKVRAVIAADFAKGTNL